MPSLKVWQPGTPANRPNRLQSSRTTKATPRQSLSVGAIAVPHAAPSSFINHLSARYKGKIAADLASSVKGKPVHARAMKKSRDKDPGQVAEWTLDLSE